MHTLDMLWDFSSSSSSEIYVVPLMNLEVRFSDNSICNGWKLTSISIYKLFYTLFFPYQMIHLNSYWSNMNYEDCKDKKIWNFGEQFIFQRLVKYFYEALMIPLSGIWGLGFHYILGGFTKTVLVNSYCKPMGLTKSQEFAQVLLVKLWIALSGPFLFRCILINQTSKRQTIILHTGDNSTSQSLLVIAPLPGK